jgi:hypothetical protein
MTIAASRTRPVAAVSSGRRLFRRTATTVVITMSTGIATQGLPRSTISLAGENGPVLVQFHVAEIAVWRTLLWIRRSTGINGPRTSTLTVNNVRSSSRPPGSSHGYR